MPKPLHLFIKPPYRPTDNPPGSWTLVYSYGVEQPPAPAARIIHTHTLLQTTGTGQLFAVAEGKLSVRRSSGSIMDPSQRFEPPPPGSPLPASVNLYLHLDLMKVARDPSFRARAQLISGIAGFAYLHVETASLTDLAECLDASTIPPGSLSRSYVIDLFVRGIVDVFVPAGHAIGKASLEDAPSGSRQIGFTALCRYGAIDPSYTYDLMRDFVADGQPDLDAFLALVPKQWPVLNPNIPDPIKDTESILYPWAVLTHLRTSRNLNALQWRQVGNNQKRLWRNRLLSRVGHAPAGSTDPPFEFDDLDWQNLFQLEAVVEFYANYDDPWAPNAQPRPPSDNQYIHVDFLNPAGTAATASGHVVTLNVAPDLVGYPDLTQVNYPDLTRVRRNKDTLFLENDNPNHPSHLYLITDVDDEAKTVTLDPNGPAPPQTGTSPWVINLRPVLVIIDSFGRRQDALGLLQGKRATVQPNNPKKLEVHNSPDLSRVNPNFDTIYLPADTNRPSRTYRITKVENNSTPKTVTLDGNPILDGGGGSSAWHIPAGISGEPPAMGYNLGPVANGTGFDHYDGILFVLQGGEIIGPTYGWSSFTSRNYAPGNQSLSSVRGNSRYYFSSYRSPLDPQHPQGAPFRNYCFSVVDVGVNYDGVRKARFYFSTPVTNDSVQGGGPG